MAEPFQFDPSASFTGSMRGFCMVCGEVLPEGKLMGICAGEHKMTDTERAAYARGYRAGQVAMRERAADAGYAVANDAANGAGKLWTKDYWDGDTPDAGRVLDGLPTEVPAAIRALPVEDPE